MNKIFKLKYLLLFSFFISCFSNLFGQVSITTAGTAFTENFDGMTATGTTTPTGWYIGTATTAASTTVIVGTGSSNAGGNYNYGVTGTNLITDRALGSLASSSTKRNTEARFTNNTGSSISSFTISYDGEQWRLGQTASSETGLVLYYSTDGTTFTTMGTAYNFTPPIVNGTAGALDGNATANRTSGIGGTYTAPSAIANGTTFYLRWVDTDNAGSDAASAIDNFSITAISPAACATPTAAATSLIFGTITSTSIQASFTAASPASDSYLIVMSANISLVSNPVDGQVYNIGDNVGDGSVVAKGSATNFTATGLSPQTKYYFFVFPMNANCTGGPLYYTPNLLTGSATTSAGVPPCTAPTNQPTNLVFTTTNTNSIAGSFTATTADEYLVVRSTAASLTNNPVNTTTYNSGDVLGNGTVVQRSNATTFTASGLVPNTNYYFFVFSLNSLSCTNGPVYNVTNPLTASQATTALAACIKPTAQPTNLVLTTSSNSISGTFTGASGADNYLVIKSTVATLGATPTDGTDYAAGTIFGNGTVLSNSPNTSFIAPNLTPNTTYYFFVFASNNNCTGGTKYATQSPLTNNITTTSTPANNYYFGNLHAHSDYSDGNKDSLNATPTDDYNYAMGAQCMDFLGISEHNHYTAGNHLSTYHQGTAQANAFTTAHTNFLALYGMEWGTISGGGHVLVYGDGMDDLWGWEQGSGGWGATNNYDTYVPKNTYTGSTGVFNAVNANVSKNTFATLAHPNSSDYNSIASTYDVLADNAIVGSAVESGPAFSTSKNYSDPASSLSYLSYYQTLLSKGYHLGPTIDHDNHNTTFGRATYSRTAVIAPTLSKTDIIAAMRNMHFYATQDCDTKVDFTINTKILGSIFTDKFAPNISVVITDATTAVSSAVIKVMFGIPGSGITAVSINSVTGSSLQYTDNTLANLATGYYYIDITNGSSRIITAPIWYSRDDSKTMPVKLSIFTVQKKDKSAQLDWVTEQELNSSYFMLQRSSDGKNWTAIAKVNAAGNSSISKAYKLLDNAPLNGTNYYRLKQIDIDGKFEYSAVKNVTFNTDYTLGIYPNPASNFINIKLSKKNTNGIDIELLDVSGKVLRKLTTTQNILNITTAGIAKGIYFIKVMDTNAVITQRIIIE